MANHSAIEELWNNTSPSKPIIVKEESHETLDNFVEEESDSDSDSDSSTEGTSEEVDIENKSDRDESIEIIEDENFSQRQSSFGDSRRQEFYETGYSIHHGNIFDGNGGQKPELLSILFNCERARQKRVDPDEALSKFGFTLCHKILIAANIIALIWVNFHKFVFLQTSGTTRDDVVILEAPTTTTTTAAIIPSTTSSTVNSMSSMIAESVPVSETVPVSSTSDTVSSPSETVSGCEAHWIIKAVQEAVVSAKELLDTKRNHAVYDELGDIEIWNKHHMDNITQLYDDLQRPVIVTDHRSWLFKHLFEYRNLSSHVRVVIIGNLDASSGNFGDLSVRIGFEPNNIFTKWNHWGGATVQEFKEMLDDERIVGVFVAQHTLIEHEKLISIPLGTNWNKKNLDNTWKRMKENDFPSQQRMKLLDSFAGPKLSRARATQYLNNTDDFRGVFEYYAKRPNWIDDSLNTKFQLAPPGAGFDCFRSIETFVLGVIPIELTSTMDRTYEKLPVLFVESYKDVTKEFLEKKYAEFCENQDQYDFSRLSKTYWKQLILDVRDHGWKILNERHPLKYPSGQRYYTQDKEEMRKMWKYIRNTFRLR